VTNAATTQTPEYASAPMASTPSTVTYVCTNVFTPLTRAKVAVLLMTILVRGLKFQMLCLKVSDKVADAGLNAVLLASAREGAEVAAGVKMNDFAATPKARVIGKRDIRVAE
jgi:hypothetical protein